VVLAKVTLPAPPKTDISIDNITFRRQIYSTAVLQEQLIACCCKEQPQQRPAKVIRVDPPDGAEFHTGEQPQNDPPPAFIEISFDKPLQRGTVNPNTVQVIQSEAGGAEVLLEGNVTYNDSLNDSLYSARYTPAESFRGSGSGTTYTLTVIGDEPNPIRDTDGLALDGDANGSPGGKYTSTFTVFFIVG
jgi:hypothetical protein